jgi:hypothetical protein
MDCDDGSSDSRSNCLDAFGGCRLGPSSLCKEHDVSSFLGRGKTMGSRTKVRNFTYQAIAASDTNKKLDAIAHAIYELADLVDNKLNHIEQKLR